MAGARRARQVPASAQLPRNSAGVINLAAQLLQPACMSRQAGLRFVSPAPVHALLAAASGTADPSSPCFASSLSRLYQRITRCCSLAQVLLRSQIQNFKRFVNRVHIILNIVEKIVLYKWAVNRETDLMDLNIKLLQ